MSSQSFNPASAKRSPSTSAAASGARGVTDFLSAHDKLGALLPAVTRMAQLQKDCAKNLSVMFDACDILQFASGQLVLAVPSPALATKLKQQLPKLQESLCRLGWQVNAIRLRVQVIRLAPAPVHRPLTLPPSALPALSALVGQLEDAPRNADLKAALVTMLQRHHVALG